MNTSDLPPTHGGARPGSGRKPKHGTRMVQKTIRLPRETLEQLEQEFGTLQKAVEALLIRGDTAGFRDRGTHR